MPLTKTAPACWVDLEFARKKGALSKNPEIKKQYFRLLTASSAPTKNRSAIDRQFDRAKRLVRFL